MALDALDLTTSNNTDASKVHPLTVLRTHLLIAADRLRDFSLLEDAEGLASLGIAVRLA
jgi:hypothetical protein